MNKAMYSKNPHQKLALLASLLLGIVELAMKHIAGMTRVVVFATSVPLMTRLLLSVDGFSGNLPLERSKNKMTPRLMVVSIRAIRRRPRAMFLK